MKLTVKVIPNSKENKIEKENGILIVRLKEKAEKGKANIALIKLLTKYFNSKVRIVSGHRSRNKIIEIEN